MNISIFLDTVPRVISCTAILFCLGQSAGHEEKIVIDDLDLEKINSSKLDILRRSREVMYSSSTAPYLDCDGYRELLRLDNKIIPILLSDLVKLDESSVLYGKNHYHPYPQNDREWMESARKEQQENSLNVIPRFISLIALAGTSHGKADHRTGYDGGGEIYKWLKWWKENKSQFAFRFKGSENFDIGDLDVQIGWPHLSCRMIDGLLNVRAGATIKNIIENAAAEAGAKVFVGDDGRKTSYPGGSLTNLIVAVNFKEMTFDEFASAVAEKMQINYPWRKENGIYYFGTGDPAPGRWMMEGVVDDLVCEIKMDRTVFKNDARMPLDFSLRYMDRKGTSVGIVAGTPAENYPVFVVEIMDSYGNLLTQKSSSNIATNELNLVELGGGKPQKQYVGVIDLGKLFDFKNPGDYTVTFKYKTDQGLKFSSGIWWGELISGHVFLKIMK